MATRKPNGPAGTASKRYVFEGPPRAPKPRQGTTTRGKPGTGHGISPPKNLTRSKGSTTNGTVKTPGSTRSQFKPVTKSSTDGPTYKASKGSGVVRGANSRSSARTPAPARHATPSTRSLTRH